MKIRRSDPPKASRKNPKEGVKLDVPDSLKRLLEKFPAYVSNDIHRACSEDQVADWDGQYTQEYSILHLAHIVSIVLRCKVCGVSLHIQRKISDRDAMQGGLPPHALFCARELTKMVKQHREFCGHHQRHRKHEGKEPKYNIIYDEVVPKKSKPKPKPKKVKTFKGDVEDAKYPEW